MALYIFQCEKCKHLIKHSLDKLMGKIYIFDCPQCKLNNKFVFLREGKVEFDFMKHGVQIKNKRRRGGDRLHDTIVREKKEND